jgi:hypothetical protein
MLGWRSPSAHKEACRNELVDDGAKEAVRGTTSEYTFLRNDFEELPTSSEAAKWYYGNDLNTWHSQILRSHRRGQLFLRIDASMPSNQFRKQTDRFRRASSSLLVQSHSTKLPLKQNITSRVSSVRRMQFLLRITLPFPNPMPGLWCPPRTPKVAAAKAYTRTQIIIRLKMIDNLYDTVPVSIQTLWARHNPRPLPP